ncbi:MAG: hypothetical protein ACREL9_12680 [Gemmatimonadales bacterium]
MTRRRWRGERTAGPKRARASGLALVVVGAAVGCTENVTAPGRCQDYCPSGQITVVDTMLRTVIERDSAFRGYLLPHEGAVLLAASLAAVDSRPIFRLDTLQAGFRFGTDTTLRPITVDSARLQLAITRRDTNATNLTLKVYRLPITIDTAATFASLAAAFADPPVDSVNVTVMLALPPVFDSTVSDTVRTDPATGHKLRINRSTGLITLLLLFDTSEARYVAADSGKVAYGVRVSADSLASIALEAAFELDPLSLPQGPRMTWFVRADSSGTAVPRTLVTFTVFDSFVLDPPAPAIDSTLAVGGIPAARSLLRVRLPRFIRDSTQILRATLLLVPVSAAQGAPIDSLLLLAHGVEADLGKKSPLVTQRFLGDSTRMAATWVHTGSLDTVRIEITRLLRTWSIDTTLDPAFMLRIVPEGSRLGEIRFRPSADSTVPNARPAIRITYAERFPFGVP